MSCIWYVCHNKQFCFVLRNLCEKPQSKRSVHGRNDHKLRIIQKGYICKLRNKKLALRSFVQPKEVFTSIDFSQLIAHLRTQLSIFSSSIDPLNFRASIKFKVTMKLLIASSLTLVMRKITSMKPHKIWITFHSQNFDIKIQ